MRLRALTTAAQTNRLLMQERKNRVTGRLGLLVCESWEPTVPHDVTLVAELLGDPSGDWEAQTICMDHLGCSARNGELSVVAHGRIECPTAFIALVSRKDDAVAISYLARLLTTAGDIAQWSC